jgi:hypothetical protein
MNPPACLKQAGFIMKLQIIPILIALISDPIQPKSTTNIETMEKYEVNAETVKGYGLYNVLLEYSLFEKNYNTKTFHSIGYSYSRKIDSTTNIKKREFVISPENKKIEITNINEIHQIDEKYRDHKTTSNQVYSSEKFHLIYQFIPKKNIEGSIEKEAVIEMINEFNDFLKNRCKFANKAAHAPPFNYIRFQAKNTTADACVIISDEFDYLTSLNPNQTWKQTTRSLIIPLKSLHNLPQKWSINETKITHIFPWRIGVDLPKVTTEGVWIWGGVLRWPWQSPNGWIIPQFYRIDHF